MNIKSFLINFIAALILFFINVLFGHFKSKSKITFKYAGFGFDNIENTDFSGNFAQMIVHPPVFVAITAGLCQYFFYGDLVKDLWLIVPFYWLFRFFTIYWKNLFLLTNWKMQIELCIISILLSEGTLLFIVNLLLKDNQKIFISVDEFRDAVWFAIIAYIAKLTWDLTKYKMVGETLFASNVKTDVIIRRYNKFYNRYNTYIEDVIKDEYKFNSKHYKDHFVCLLYSIMIYEDQNRPPWIRIIEYFSAFLRRKHKHSLGVMQVQSDVIISNKTSIRYAIKKLYPTFSCTKAYYKVDACILDYNSDDDYYSQVISIYSDLQTHLNLKHIDFYYIDKSQQKIKKRNAKG